MRQAISVIVLTAAWFLGTCAAGDSPAATKRNVAYGTHGAQVLDFWQAPSDKPTPLVFFIHGGSWVNGSRKEVERRGLQQFLDAGISVVSIEYRKVADAERAGIKPPVQWPLSDAARALQFVRNKAGEWNIDKNRIGASGVSAGACSALWLALHDDMADLKDSDPVARESTRVLCAGVFDAQTTLDPKDTREWIPNATYGGHAFGIHKGDEPNSFQKFVEAREEILPWIKAYSPMEWVSADDPPVFCAYASAAHAAGKPQKYPTHAPVFGLKLKEKLDAVQVECHVTYQGAKPGTYTSQIAFLIDKLTHADKPK